MRSLTYAGETVVTTDGVASTLVELTAALARRGLAEAVRIPVFDPETHDRTDAELVVGIGSGVLSLAATWPGPDPDASEAMSDLRRRLERLGAGAPSTPRTPHYDRVLDEPVFGHDDDAVVPPIPLRPRHRR